MAQKKKLVDLVTLTENVNESHITQDYKTRIKSWEKWLEKRQDDEASSMNKYMQENTEYLAIEGWVAMFLKKRLDWISKSVSDPELRLKYLMVLPPFSQKGNIKRFLLHFFQLADHRQQSKIVFNELNTEEKELRILWDMYKITRTVETIQTLKRWMVSKGQTNSRSSGKQALAGLDNLQKSLVMVFRTCVKKEHQNLFLTRFPKNVFTPQAILQRIESENYLINQKIIESLDYRNFFFFIYFKSKIRGDVDGETKEFEINYLDYEIIRQEFLIYWITQRLKDNPKKKEVFEQYRFGSKTLAQVTANRPEMELKMLKRLPKDVFDDLVALVNEEVDPEMRTPVDAMSSSFGSFAKEMLNFERAKVIAQKPVAVIRAFIERTNALEAASDKATQSGSQKAKEGDQTQANHKSKEKQRPKKRVKIQLVDPKIVSFPYFCENNAHYSRQFKVFKLHLGHNGYSELNSKIELFLERSPNYAGIVRRAPRQEWAIPFLVHNAIDSVLTGQLLILGAELRRVPSGISGATNSGVKYEYQSYFVYGTEKKYVDLGIITEVRQVGSDRFFIYDPSHPKIVARATRLIETLTTSQEQVLTDPYVETSI